MLMPARSIRSLSTVIIAAGLVAPLAIGGVGRAGAAPIAAQTRARVITLSTAPNGVAVNPKTDTIYAEAYAGDVFVISGKTDTVTATINADSPGPCGIAVDASRHRVYVASYSSPAIVSVINSNTDKLVKKFHAGVGSEGGLAFDAKTNRLYVLQHDAGKLAVINAKTDKVIKNVAVGVDANCVAVDPSTDLIYVTHLQVGATSAPPDTVVDGKTNKVIAHVRTGDEPATLAIDTATHRVYVADNDTGIVYAVTSHKHGKDTKVTGKIKLGGGTAPLGIAVDPSTNRIYVADNNSNKVSIVSGKTGKVIRTVKVGVNPVGVAVDPSTGTAYVCSPGSNEINIIPAN